MTAGTAESERSTAAPGRVVLSNRVRGQLLVVIFGILLAGYLWVSNEAIAGMVAAWARTQTYQHGFFVVPAVLVLIWHRRAWLTWRIIRVEPFGLPALAFALLLGVIGSLADLQVLRHFAVVLTVLCLAGTLLGRHIIWRLKLPLVFLLFAVPAGDELVPHLIDLTATITTEGLKLFGIPVWREGAFIEVPGGRFEVARVCSGIRYLIASVAVATLFAGLVLKSNRTRLIFVTLGVLLPLVANGLRALGIVMLAYYSDMRIAVGVDHIIYGWLFFGLVMVLLLWVGRRLAAREGDAQGFVVPQINNSVRGGDSGPVLTLVPLACAAMLYASLVLGTPHGEEPMEAKTRPDCRPSMISGVVPCPRL